MNQICGSAGAETRGFRSSRGSRRAAEDRSSVRETAPEMHRGSDRRNGRVTSFRDVHMRAGQAAQRGRPVPYVPARTAHRVRRIRHAAGVSSSRRPSGRRRRQECGGAAALPVRPMTADPRATPGKRRSPGCGSALQGSFGSGRPPGMPVPSEAPRNRVGLPTVDLAAARELFRTAESSGLGRPGDRRALRPVARRILRHRLLPRRGPIPACTGGGPARRRARSAEQQPCRTSTSGGGLPQPASARLRSGGGACLRSGHGRDRRGQGSSTSHSLIRPDAPVNWNVAHARQGSVPGIRPRRWSGPSCSHRKPDRRGWNQRSRGAGAVGFGAAGTEHLRWTAVRGVAILP